VGVRNHKAGCFRKGTNLFFPAWLFIGCHNRGRAWKERCGSDRGVVVVSLMKKTGVVVFMGKNRENGVPIQQT